MRQNSKWRVKKINKFSNLYLTLSSFCHSLSPTKWIVSWYKCFYYYRTKYRQNDLSRKSTMLTVLNSFSTCNYMSTVNNRKTRTKCEICSKLTIKTTERHHCLRPVVFIVNFEHISHIVLVFLLFNLSRYMSAGLSILCSSHK